MISTLSSNHNNRTNNNAMAVIREFHLPLGTCLKVNEVE